MTESKYGRYILREPKGAPIPPRKSSQIRVISLGDEALSGIGGSGCNFNFMGVIEPHLMADPPHKHDYDEFLFFIGSDPQNESDLGGEVEIALGEEWEKHLITTSAVVCLPKGVQHCPIYIKKVTRPFFLGHVMAASKYSSSATPPAI